MTTTVLASLSLALLAIAWAFIEAALRTRSARLRENDAHKRQVALSEVVQPLSIQALKLQNERAAAEADFLRKKANGEWTDD